MKEQVKVSGLRAATNCSELSGIGCSLTSDCWVPRKIFLLFAVSQASRGQPPFLMHVCHDGTHTPYNPSTAIRESRCED
jgi:hypothetical protein